MARDVVLLHGFTHTGASWDPVVAALGESYRALAPDIRGHGSAAEREPVTLEAVIEDLAELAPARFTLVGYSLGGRIALHAASRLSCVRGSIASCSSGRARESLTRPSARPAAAPTNASRARSTG